jgi:archaellum component FlaC
MNTVPQLGETLSSVELLLQQQRYDEALPILNDLMEKNPDDRETHLYRLLVLRIFVLRHSLTCAASRSTQPSRTMARIGTTVASAVHAFELFYGPLRSFLRRRPQPAPRDPDSQLPSELAELTQQDKLAMKNQEPVAEIDSLLTKLANSERKIAELHAIRDCLSDTQCENHQLQAANQELQQEIDKINNLLQASESRLGEFTSRNEWVANRNSGLQSELVELKQQLHASRKMIEELQTQQKQLDGVKSENRQLQQEIENLRSQIGWSETRLAESARQNRQTADAYARLQTELAVLEQQVEEGQAKARELEAALQELANFESREMLFNGQKRELEAQIAHLQREISARSLADSAMAVERAKEEKKAPVVRSRARRNRSFGIVPACVIFAIAGSIAVGSLSVGPKELSGPKEPAVAAALISDKQLTPIEAAPAKRNPASVTTPGEHQIRTPKPAPPLPGTFKIIRPTQVYSGPSKNSQLIASVGPGMKINVVDSRHGWLEIRSKHGRPPGFVRQEAAVRVEQG